jgi:hypothetical protein
MQNKVYKLILNNDSDLEADSVYFYSREIADKVLAHHKRGIVKIVNIRTKKSVLRKVRTKPIQGLTSNSILLDYLGIKELLAFNGDDLLVKNPSLFDKYFSYYRKHPNEDVRLAYSLFWLALIIPVIINHIVDFLLKILLNYLT